MDIKTIKDASIANERVVVRVDFDVAFDKDVILDDARIQHNMETLRYLLEHNNRLVLIAKRGRPLKRTKELSLAPIVKVLPTYLPGYTFKLVDDFLTEPKETFSNQGDKEIIVLENIRFYPQEQLKDEDFTQALAALGTVFVNDCFSMAHRVETSVIGIPKYLPSYIGLHFAEEVSVILKTMEADRHPFVTVVGGAKVSTKINLLRKLSHISDYLLIGGGLANTFLAAQGYNMGESFYEYEEMQTARQLFYETGPLPVHIVIPTDVIVGDASKPTSTHRPCLVEDVPDELAILDIGPETRQTYKDIISHAKTTIWNGPMGMFEHEQFAAGTNAVFNAMNNNKSGTNIIGGGDTLAAISNHKDTSGITHISTGGGAMLQLIERGDLPALEALRRSQSHFRVL